MLIERVGKAHVGVARSDRAVPESTQQALSAVPRGRANGKRVRRERTQFGEFAAGKRLVVFLLACARAADGP